MSILCCRSLTSIQALSEGDFVGQAATQPVVLQLPVGLVGGPVGPGNIPSDVEAVQKLLNISHTRTNVPPNLIKVDGKVGPETLGAINRFQDAHLAYHDSVVQPGKRTLQKLNEIAAGGSGVSPLKASALEVVPLAAVWVSGALASMNLITPASFSGPPQPIVEIINKHFHFDRLKANHAFYLQKLRNVFKLSLDVLGDADRFFQEGSGQGFADAPMGGFHFKNSPLFNHITIRAQFPPCGPNARAAMLVHECAHFVGFVNEIRHFAMEFPEPNGAPQDGSAHNYAQLTPDEAVLNASTYAAYAIHVTTGIDSRFGLGKQAL